MYVPVSNPSFGKSVRVIDTNSYSVHATIPVPLDPEVAAVNPGTGNVWVASYYAGVISILDTRLNRVMGKITLPMTNRSGWAASPSAITFSADGGLAYVLDRNGGNEHGSLFIIDANGRSIEKRIPFVGTPETERLSADGETLYVFAPDYQSSSYSPDKPVQQYTYLVDTSTFEIVPGTSSSSGIFTDNAYVAYIANPGAAISPDGRTVVVPETGANSGQVSTSVDIYSVGSADKFKVVHDVVSSPRWVDFSADGSQFFVRDQNGSSISVIATDTLRILTRLSLR